MGPCSFVYTVILYEKNRLKIDRNILVTVIKQWKTAHLQLKVAEWFQYQGFDLKFFLVIKFSYPSENSSSDSNSVHPGRTEHFFPSEGGGLASDLKCGY